MSKEAYYFSHDANARRDPEIVQLISVYGWEGYGWYWAIVEMMREQEGYKLNITSKYFYQGLAKELSSNPEKMTVFIDDCVNEFNVMRKDDEFLWTDSLLKRMAKYQRSVEQRREAGKKSAAKRMKDKGISTPVERPLQQTLTPVKQLKETKEKETKEKKKKDYITPRLGEHKNVRLTKDEYAKLIDKYKEPKALEMIERLSGHIASKGDKYKSHYATILNWIRRDGQNQPTITAEQEKNLAGYKRDLRIAEEALHRAEEAKQFSPSPDSDKRVQDKQREVNRLRKELGI